MWKEKKMDNMRWGKVSYVSVSQSGGQVKHRQEEGEWVEQSCGILRPGTDTNPLIADEAVAALRVVSAERWANPSQT